MNPTIATGLWFCAAIFIGIAIAIGTAYLIEWQDKPNVDAEYLEKHSRKEPWNTLDDVKEQNQKSAMVG
jgi:hypothetical protein